MSHRHKDQRQNKPTSKEVKVIKIHGDQMKNKNRLNAIKSQRVKIGFKVLLKTSTKSAVLMASGTLDVHVSVNVVCLYVALR